MYPRKIQPLAEDLLKEFRVLYVTGPRQAGKTTLARAIAKNLQMDYLSLDDQPTLASVTSDPHGFVRSLGQRKLVIDEFQYAPALIPAIKEASDRLPPHEHGKFLLTGSTDIFRSAKVQESLPGHMARLELMPLSLSELHEQSLNIVDYLLRGDFQSRTVPFVSRKQIARLLLQGGYPELQGKSPRSQQIWFKSYIEGRLFKDFESLYAARGDYHSRLQALVTALAGLSGNLLKYANLANDLQLNDKVTKSYIEILELMFIVQRVPAYVKNRARRLVMQMPKIHYIDTGLASHLLGLRNEAQVLDSQFYGSLVESLIYMELYKQKSWATEDTTLLHFRDNRQREVDIVMEASDGGIIGIEVKASASINAADFKGLIALADFAGNQFRSGVVFYSGDRVLPFKVGEQHFHALPIGLLN
ncbi:MAG: ATP-binding protein [Proteobacteria bacterium]|nr:ATP-binding protein [Pseudomonadota bacterium]